MLEIRCVLGQNYYSLWHGVADDIRARGHGEAAGATPDDLRYRGDQHLDLSIVRRFQQATIRRDFLRDWISPCELVHARVDLVYLCDDKVAIESAAEYVEDTYASGPARRSCLSHLNKKYFSMIACTAVTRPLVVFLGARNPNAKLCPYGRRVSPVLAHSAFGGVAQEPKTNVLRAYER